MKTQKPVTVAFCQGRFLLGLCLFSLVPNTSHAVAGVADTVIITSDLTDAWKWPRELAQWQRIAGLGQAQLKELGNLRETLGNAEASVSDIVGSVSKVTESLSRLEAIKGGEGCTEAEAARELPGGRSELVDTTQKVSGSMEVFGAKVSRDTVRHKATAILLALRQRQEDAEKQLEEVLGSELAEQKELLKKLKSAATAMDLEAVQAALAASKQRLELAQAKVGQVAEQSGLMEARAGLEKLRKLEADKEWAETVAEKLKARALTALHAQKGRSS